MPGSFDSLILEEAATMNDRQIYLYWLKQCNYISNEEYQREFLACKGLPI
jgi:hypothetical protein